MSKDKEEEQKKTADTDQTKKDPVDKKPDTGEKKSDPEQNKKTAGEKKDTKAENKADGKPEKQEEKKDTKDSSSSEGFFKKEKKDPKDEKIAELTDRLQRQLAEFDNYRKRTEKEKAAMYDLGAGDVIAKVLDVVDNFERGLKGADEKDPFVEGMNKVYKQLSKVLKDLGVTPIEAEGKEFDPSLHNAVMHEENPDVGENIVTQELQKGYKYKDTVIRHSMVKVAN